MRHEDRHGLAAGAGRGPMTLSPLARWLAYARRTARDSGRPLDAAEEAERREMWALWETLTTEERLEVERAQAEELGWGTLEGEE